MSQEVKIMIEGVVIKPLRVIPDDRGYLMEILRNDDELFAGFGQAYVTACYLGVVKAWHAHRRQVDNICCVQGTAKLGIFDDRHDSPTCGQTDAIILGMIKPVLVLIPPLVWHGFTPVGSEAVLLLNIPTQHYDYDDPDELRRPPFDPDIPFQWHTQGG